MFKLNEKFDELFTNFINDDQESITIPFLIGSLYVEKRILDLSDEIDYDGGNKGNPIWRFNINDKKFLLEFNYDDGKIILHKLRI